MAVGAIPPVGPGAFPQPERPDGVRSTQQANSSGGSAGFSEAIQRGLAQVSEAERTADAAAQEVATGTGDIHQLMATTAKASLSVDLLVQVRNRAVEAYQEIMRIQV